MNDDRRYCLLCQHEIDAIKDTHYYVDELEYCEGCNDYHAGYVCRSCLRSCHKILRIIN
jgi:hypothetical protein